MVTVEISMLCISYHNDEKCLFVEPSSGGSDSVSLRCSPEHSSVNKAIQLIPEGSRSGTLENLQIKLYGTHTYTCIFFSSRKFIVFISLSKMFMTHKMPRTVPMKPGSRPPGCIPAGGGKLVESMREGRQTSELEEKQWPEENPELALLMSLIAEYDAVCKITW